MGSKIKVAVLERDGVEILETEEQDLRSDVVEVQSPVSLGFEPTEDDVRQCLASLKTSVDSAVFGRDYASQIKVASETTTGASFVTYDTLNFNVANNTGPNTYRLNADFLWSHNSASNDIRVRVLLDGIQLGEEMQVEAKDPNADQQIQNNLLFYSDNLSPGAHTLELQYRPAAASRVSRMYRSVLEAWRVA